MVRPRAAATRQRGARERDGLTGRSPGGQRGRGARARLTGLPGAFIASARLPNPAKGRMDPNTAEAKHLLSFIERIERLEDDKKQVAEDIKDVYAEAKGTGYDIKIMRKIVSIRRQDKDKRREEEEILGLYLAALGMQ